MLVNPTTSAPVEGEAERGSDAQKTPPEGAVNLIRESQDMVVVGVGRGCGCGCGIGWVWW
jgi:hypothetical protein